jgi:hypothetical protein
VTNEELSQYVHRAVELRFGDGRTVIGELVDDEAQIAIGMPFAIKQPEAASDAGPTWIGIADAARVEWVRIIGALPETLD